MTLTLAACLTGGLVFLVFNISQANPLEFDVDVHSLAGCTRLTEADRIARGYRGSE